MNNPPAFPITAVYDASREQVNPSDAYGGGSGMTLLDYFAAKALQGLVANETLIFSHEDRAKFAYCQAKAMLAERAKHGL